jgi:iron(III) transport system ATP-binding protein
MSMQEATTATPQVRIRNLVKKFSTRRGEVVALDHVSLDIGRSERVVLLGPSGCGKTTLLRCVAGLEQPDEGEIEIDGKLVFSSSQGIFVPPEARGVSMMFQSYALWPHMTVADNVAFPLHNLPGPKNARSIRARVDEVLAMAACSGLQGRYPAQLSGGQQQRVALARAVVANDPVVLFDEPLSNVDAQVREQLRLELVTLQHKLGFAWLYVTHDQTEATAVAHRIAVFRSGRIVQVGSPNEVYSSPNSIYVAEFVGASNEVAGQVRAAHGDLLEIDSDLGPLQVRASGSLPTGQVKLMFRPEQIHIEPRLASQGIRPNSFSGRVEATLFLGNCTEYAVQVGPRRIIARSMLPTGVREDDAVTVSVAPDHVRVFSAAAGEA